MTYFEENEGNFLSPKEEYERGQRRNEIGDIIRILKALESLKKQLTESMERMPEKYNGSKEQTARFYQFLKEIERTEKQFDEVDFKVFH
jgi:hypothetical protein